MARVTRLPFGKRLELPKVSTGLLELIAASADPAFVAAVRAELQLRAESDEDTPRVSLLACLDTSTGKVF